MHVSFKLYDFAPTSVYGLHRQQKVDSLTLVLKIFNIIVVILYCYFNITSSCKVSIILNLMSSESQPIAQMSSMTIQTSQLSLDELSKLREELADAKQTILMKEKQLHVHSRTIDALHNHMKLLKDRIQALEERNKKHINPETNSTKEPIKEQTQQSPHYIASNSREAQKLILQLEYESQQLRKQVQNLKAKVIGFDQLKLKFESQIQILTNQLSKFTKNKNVLMDRYGQFQRQIENDKKQQNLETSFLPTDVNSQSLEFKENGFSEEDKYDEDKFDEDEFIKINKTTQGVIQCMRAHLLTLSQTEKFSFLNMIGSWSEQMIEIQLRQQRREKIVDQLYNS